MDTTQPTSFIFYTSNSNSKNSLAFAFGVGRNPLNKYKYISLIYNFCKLWLTIVITNRKTSTNKFERKTL